jgi:glycosyltransferase involved in cell wall biosynthesis
MKISIFATSFPRNQKDYVGQWVWGLARALVAEGATVKVIIPHDKQTESHEVWHGVDIHRFSYWWPKSQHGLCYGAGIPTNVRTKKWLALQFPVLEAAFLSAMFRYASDSDVINAHWTFAALPAVIASNIMRKPLVTHAYSAEFVPKALAPINRLVVNNSKAVISISQYTYDMVEQLISPKRHQVIGLGVNPEKVAPEDFDVAAFRAAQGIRPDETFLFAVGRLVERKGYHVLIEAVNQLVKQGKAVHLLLAGTGPQRDALQAQINAAGIAEQAQLVGFVPDEALSQYMKAADVLLMPSVMDRTGDTEGLGLPTVEAMANGTPVIASNIGGILDIVKHEQTGLLVPPDDPTALAQAINRLIEDPALQQSLISNGLALTENEFSWRQIARQTLNVFHNII